MCQKRESPFHLGFFGTDGLGFFSFLNKGRIFLCGNPSQGGRSFVTSRARANPGTHATNRLSSKKTDTTKHNPNYGDTVVLFFVLSKREKRERERES